MAQSFAWKVEFPLPWEILGHRPALVMSQPHGVQSCPVFYAAVVSLPGISLFFHLLVFPNWLVQRCCWTTSPAPAGGIALNASCWELRAILELVSYLCCCGGTVRESSLNRDSTVSWACAGNRAVPQKRFILCCKLPCTRSIVWSGVCPVPASTCFSLGPWVTSVFACVGLCHRSLRIVLQTPHLCSKNPLAQHLAPAPADDLHG